MIGHFDNTADVFLLNETRISLHRQKASHTPDACRNCVNVWNCTYGCPDRCVASRNEKKAQENASQRIEINGPEFRCRLNQRLVYKWILEAADKLADTSVEQADFSSEDNDWKLINEYLKQIPYYVAIPMAQIYRSRFRIRIRNV
jgi:hypothetical protein